MTDTAPLGGITRPQVSIREAERIAEDHYGLIATAVELGSNQDRNFLITTSTGERTVLRIDNETVTDRDRDAQHIAIQACTDAGIHVPQMLPGIDGNIVQRAGTFVARLSEFADGDTMVDIPYFAPVVIREFGEFAARSVLAMRHLPVTQGSIFDRDQQWDMRRAGHEVQRLVGSIHDPELRERVQHTALEAETALHAVSHRLPVQVIHGDLTDDNVLGVLGEDRRVHPHTLIDFGDLGAGWRVAELAVTVSSLLHHVAGDPLRVLDAIEAHASLLGAADEPLTADELFALWPLVTLRASLLIASGWRQLELEGDNEYVRERMPGEQAIFEAATRYNLAEMHEHIAARLGIESRDNTRLQERADPPLRSLIPDLQGHVTILDPGVESAQLAAGRWLEEDAETQLIADAFAEGAGAAVFPYGVYRLTRTRVNRHESVATFPVFTEIAVSGMNAHDTDATQPALRVTAPVSGVVSDITATAVWLTIPGEWMLGVEGLTPLRALTVGTRVDEGETIGTLGSTRLRVAIRTDAAPHTDPDIETPLSEQFVTPERVPGVSRMWADPAALLGIESYEQRDESADELRRRETIFASAQERYYEQPMQIERGWRHHLIDTTGRAYIDMVNNVTGLGHGHPAVAQAVHEQMLLLGTNSRFLYRSLAEYSERLLQLLPEAPAGQEPLDTVLLVNSGSEAVDLAIRVAQAASKRDTIIALREAYHGWTYASDAVTTSAFDNPYALESRPPWVHIADVPNTYRGTHRGDDASARYLADLRRDVDNLVAKGTPVGGFICESVLGNAGGVVLPDGYLRGAYEIVRGAGGVVIADEVQVGFGRMGTTFWGFEQSGVYPDIIAIAKPMGNGFPIGGVITSKRIADALSSQGQFFSSAGGNPVSCAVGLAVLDTMEAEGLQDNARVVGAHLVQGFTRLAKKHPLIGPIHGKGLYLGVELVRDHTSLEPATAEAEAICERLKELGVIVLTTSERSNVLKIKPPLCLTIESADTVLEAIDRVLTEGW